MCLGMNPDILAPGERCASTSNRNFEGRQGRGGRTHLVSPQMAAAAAITGHFTDIRNWKFKNQTAKSEVKNNASHQHPHLPRRPSDRPNIDTDQIIPKQFLKRIERTGYGDFLFYDWRRDSGRPRRWPTRPRPSSSTSTDHKGAKILIAEKNFGCGSSREHAAWALTTSASSPSSPPASPTSSSPTPARTASSSSASPKPTSKP